MIKVVCCQHKSVSSSSQWSWKQEAFSFLPAAGGGGQLQDRVGQLHRDTSNGSSGLSLPAVGSPHGKADQKLEDKAGHCDVAAGLREGGWGVRRGDGAPSLEGQASGRTVEAQFLQPPCWPSTSPGSGRGDVGSAQPHGLFRPRAC